MLATLDKGYLGELSQPVQKAVQNGLQAVHQMGAARARPARQLRLDHDGIQLDFRDCELTLVLADAMRTLRYEIEERGVHLRIEPLPAVVADSWALTKVFMNLLGNAITVNGRSDQQAVIRVWPEDQGTEWNIPYATTASASPRRTTRACSAGLSGVATRAGSAARGWACTS